MTSTLNIISVDLGWKNLAYIHMNISNEKVQIKKWEVKDVLTEKFGNINKATIEELVNAATPKIFELVRQWTEEKPDIVYLEQQPLGVMSKNIKTKILSHIFQSLLVSQSFPVKFISPKRKLEGLSNEDRTYSENKKFAVSSAETVLLKHELKEELEMFQNHKGKKDDLADCFLQGYYAGLNDLNKPEKKKRKKILDSSKKKKVKNNNIKMEF